MARSHYEVLGVGRNSTAIEIRTAYRKIVMLHHPDRSSDPGSKPVFLAATAAYEVLNDGDRKRDYDDRLDIERKLTDRQRATRQASAASPRSASAKLAEIKLDVNRLNIFFSRGNYKEAETLARSILERDRRQPVPYGVLGDLAKMRGDRKSAMNFYANAAQFDPRNIAYQRRYEELLERPRAAAVHQHQTKISQAQRHSFAPLFGLMLVLLACAYVICAKENPAFPDMAPISTWTVGLIVMLFLSGAILGSCLSVDGFLGSVASIGADARGRVSPTVALATIAIVNFWAAIAMYGLIGLWRGKFDTATSRLIASVVGGTCLLGLASEASGSVSGLQVIVWGGNLVYLGALSGWMVTDALRTAGG